MKYEYKTISVFLDGGIENDDDATDILNTWAKDNWKVIHVTASAIIDPGRFEGEYNSRQILTVILEKAVE